MSITARENLFGAYAFLIGVILALGIGIMAATYDMQKALPTILTILGGIGIVFGIFVAQKDVQTFLLASVSLVLVAYTGISGLVLGAALGGYSFGHIISSVLNTLLALFVPATIVVSIKTVFSIAKV
jgi:hypothetical protein